MATGTLLHRHLPHHHHRPQVHLEQCSYLPWRDTIVDRMRFGLTAIRFKCRPSTPSFQCLKPNQQSGAVSSLAQPESAYNTEALQWVNKEARHPSVEVDPVTVIRNIFRERQASLALARAMEQANVPVQSTSVAPLPFGIRRMSDSAMGIVTVIVILAIAAVVYLVRSTRESKMTNMLTDGSSSLEPRRKLVKETIKAPDSVLTAMTIGAALVGRPKVQQEGPLAALEKGVENGQTPVGEIELSVNMSAVATEDTTPKFNGASNKESYDSDVTEDPWFNESPDKLMPGGMEKLELPEAVLAKSQPLESPCVASTMPVAEQPLSTITVGSAISQSKSATEVANSTSGVSDLDQSFTLNRKDEATTVEASEEGKYFLEEDMGLIERQSSGQALDMTLPDQEDLFIQVDQGIESAIQDSNALDESVRSQQESQVEEKGPLICEEDLDQGVATDGDDEEMTDGCMSLNQVHLQDSAAESESLESVADSAVEAVRQEQDKALEAVAPALAIGLGTAGTLFGVAGGLKVVGFAALASFISNEFFWAQSRESLWQEMRDITNHQKLLDFLARRNIVHREQEKSSV